MCVNTRYGNSTRGTSSDVPLYICTCMRMYMYLVEFMYLVFTCMPGKSYHRQLGSLLLSLCYRFQVLINSFKCVDAAQALWASLCFRFLTQVLWASLCLRFLTLIQIYIPSHQLCSSSDTSICFVFPLCACTHFFSSLFHVLYRLSGALPCKVRELLKYPF